MEDNLEQDFSKVRDTHYTLVFEEALLHLANIPDPTKVMIRYKSLGEKNSISHQSFNVSCPVNVDYCYGIKFPIPVTKLVLYLTRVIGTKRNDIEVANLSAMDLKITEIKFDPPIPLCQDILELSINGEFTYVKELESLIGKNLANPLFDVLLFGNDSYRPRNRVFSRSYDVKYPVNSSVSMKLLEEDWKPCGFVRLSLYQ